MVDSHTVLCTQICEARLLYKNDTINVLLINNQPKKCTSRKQRKEKKTQMNVLVGLNTPLNMHYIGYTCMKFLKLLLVGFSNRPGELAPAPQQTWPSCLSSSLQVIERFSNTEIKVLYNVVMFCLGCVFEFACHASE